MYWLTGSWRMTFCILVRALNSCLFFSWSFKLNKQKCQEVQSKIGSRSCQLLMLLLCRSADIWLDIQQQFFSSWYSDPVGYIISTLYVTWCAPEFQCTMSGFCCWQSPERSPTPEKIQKSRDANNSQKGHSGSSSRNGDSGVVEADNIQCAVATTSFSQSPQEFNGEQHGSSDFQLSQKSIAEARAAFFRLNNLVNSDLDLDPKMAAELQQVVKRLEAVATRLESVADNRGGGGGAVAPAAGPAVVEGRCRRKFFSGLQV